MSYPNDFVQPLEACQAPTFTFPGLTMPGFGNFSLANFEANFAGINYVLQFIPPSPSNPPSFPDISLFITPFMANVALPANYPAIDVTLGGVDISIPGQGSPPYLYDLSAEMSLIAVCIALPFLIIKTFIDGLLNLQINLPTFSGVQAILVSLLAEAGLSTPSLSIFSGCLAQAIVDLFANLI